MKGELYMKSRKTLTSLLVSIVTMMLCLCSFAGTTLAWFTDTVSNTGNKIQSGTLDVELWQDDSNMTDAQKAAYYAMTPRQALAHDVADLISIYKSQGLYEEIRPQLRQFIKTSIEMYPELFGK